MRVRHVEFMWITPHLYAARVVRRANSLRLHPVQRPGGARHPRGPQDADASCDEVPPARRRRADHRRATTRRPSTAGRANTRRRNLRCVQRRVSGQGRSTCARWKRSWIKHGDARETRQKTGVVVEIPQMRTHRHSTRSEAFRSGCMTSRGTSARRRCLATCRAHLPKLRRCAEH